MNPCKLGTDYLVGRLSKTEARDFEAHLDGCASCREEVYEWRAFERSLKDWSGSERFDSPTPADADHLMARAEGRSRWPGRPWTLAAAAAVAAVALVLVWSPFGEEEAPSLEKSSPPALIALMADGKAVRYLTFGGEAEEIAAPGDGKLVAALGEDRVGLSPGGRVRVLEAGGKTVRLVLLEGTVVCRVSPREKGGRFVVESGGYEVRVIGTRFKVARAESGRLRVTVETGEVEVLSETAVTWRLGRGDTFEVAPDGRVRSNRADPEELAAMSRLLEVRGKAGGGSTVGPPAEPAAVTQKNVGERAIEIPARTKAPSSPGASADAASFKRSQRVGGPVTSPSDTGDINTWREWVLNGRAADARRAMRAHLARHPSDAATWSLLADCERKAKRWPSAIAAYEKARVHGSDKQASHATYMMATVYQKNLRDHGRAVAMFRAYKASGYVSKELKDLTDVHLARSLIALGKRDEARALLEAVIARQGDSFVGQNAKRLLEKCEAYRP